jgi:hypothetical protein
MLEAKSWNTIVGGDSTTSFKVRGDLITLFEVEGSLRLKLEANRPKYVEG